MPAPGDPFTPTLGLVRLDIVDDIGTKAGQLNIEGGLTADRNALDHFAAQTSASFYTLFHLSGAASDNMGDDRVIGSAFNPLNNRIIQEVLAWAEKSGSGGVTQIDLQRQVGGQSDVWASILGAPGGSPNPACQLALSSSLGNYGVASATWTKMTASHNAVWGAGTMVRAVMSSSAGAAGVSGQKGVTVMVRWANSGAFDNAISQP
jgi:hypothetical protein